jgi:hypothetical protein
LELLIALGYRLIKEEAIFSLDLDTHTIALDRPRSAV